MQWPDDILLIKLGIATVGKIYPIKSMHIFKINIRLFFLCFIYLDVHVLHLLEFKHNLSCIWSINSI